MTDDLQALAQKAIELSGKATEGEWEHTHISDEVEALTIFDESTGAHFQLGHLRFFGDAAFIAFAREALPELAQAVLDLSWTCDSHYQQVNDLEVKLNLAQEALQVIAKREWPNGALLEFVSKVLETIK